MQEKLSKELIGQRVKSLRIQNNHSQAFIADILKISRSNYSQIEIGNQYPTFESLTAIARYYSKSYDWLLHGSESPDSGQKMGQKSVRKDINLAPVVVSSKVLHVEESSKPDYVTRLHSVNYLSGLPSFDLPASFIMGQENYRAFTIEEETLKSVYRGDILIGKQITNYSQIVIDEIYIIVTFTEILFCRIEDITESEFLICKTDKVKNQTFTMSFDSIQEIWMVKCKYSTVIRPIMENLETAVQSLETLINKLGTEVSKLNTKLKK